MYQALDDRLIEVITMEEYILGWWKGGRGRIGVVA